MKYIPPLHIIGQSTEKGLTLVGINLALEQTGIWPHPTNLKTKPVDSICFLLHFIPKQSSRIVIGIQISTEPNKVNSKMPSTPSKSMGKK